MWKYKLYYDGGFLRDSADLGYIYESEEEAQEEVAEAMKEYMENWELDGCDDVDENLFKYDIKEM